MDLTTIVLDLLRNREIMLSEGAWSAVAQAQHELIGNHFLSARQMIDEIDSFDSDLQSYAAMMIATRASCFLGDLGRAEQQVEQLGKHPMLGDSLALAAANYRIGLFMRLATRFDEALSCQVQAQGQFRVLGWKLEEAFCSIEIGSIMLERGDATGAIQSYLMATDVIREEAGEDAYASLLANHATALTHAGNLEMARSLYEEALSIGAFLKPSVSRAWLLQNLATVVKRQMLFDRAEKLYYEALSCIDAEDSASLYHKLKCSLVDLMIQREDDQGAETLLHELSGVDEGSVRIQTRVEILSNQAHLLYRKGEWQQALDHLRRSIDLAKAHELHDIHLALLTDALEWIDRSDLRMELLEEHRMMQNQRIDSLKRGVDHILSMRSYYEEEKARLEVVRQQELARTIVDTQATMMSQIGRDLHDSIPMNLGRTPFKVV